MDDFTQDIKTAAEAVLDAVRRRMLDGKRPFLVAFDGGSGAGKSTLAALLAEALPAAFVQSDDFYAAHIPDAAWEQYTPAQRYDAAIDWRRLRAEALEPLLAGQSARWHPFDFERPQPDGTYPLSAVLVERPPAEVIVLDGAYSCRPELADLIDFSILVDVPLAVRHRRLAAREDGAFLRAWHARWDVVEAYYFTQVRPASAFDFVVTFRGA